MLPGLDGLSLCQQVREFSHVPIIMVTAKVEEIDRLIGLESGADDYLCKPFSPRELIARIQAILRRSHGSATCSGINAEINVEINVETNQNETLRIDSAAQKIYLKNTALELTRSEYLMLRHLSEHRGQVFSRSQLLDLLSNDSLESTDRAIDSHMKNLRKKSIRLRKAVIRFTQFMDSVIVLTVFKFSMISPQSSCMM